MPYKNPADKQANTRKRMQAKREVVNFYKSSGCVDCGLRLPNNPEVFDFDHLGVDEKTDNVSRMVAGNRALDVIIEEIEKCEVVCANCHRIRTANRRKYGIPFDEYERIHIMGDVG